MMGNARSGGVREAEFSTETKRQAWDRCKVGGEPRCECCGTPFNGERPEYHHILEAALGGDNSLKNCQVLRKKCHRIITSQQSIPRVAKTKRIEAKGANIRPRGKKIPSRPFNQERW